MAMALKVDVAKACRKAGLNKPIDLVHLSHQTMGERELEREVLDTFLKQAGAYVETIRSNERPEERQRGAHALKGAARGIGAWDLAELSACVEEGESTDIAALEREVARVCTYIVLLRND